MDIEQIYETLKKAMMEVDRFEDQYCGGDLKKFNILKGAVHECLELMSEMEDQNFLPDGSLAVYEDDSFITDD